jgi:hypothetical protein
MNASFRCLAIAGMGAALSMGLIGTSVAADNPTSCQPLGYVQKRVVAKADEGIAALRGYVYITRAMHQLDMMEIAKSLDAWRADARCAERLAAATTPRQ